MTARELVRSSVIMGVFGCAMILCSAVATFYGRTEHANGADMLSAVFFCLALSFSSIALGKIEEDKS